VSYSEMGPAGAGDLLAAALRDELREKGYTEERVSFLGLGSLCMNCGASRKSTADNGGWCDRCCGMKL